MNNQQLIELSNVVAGVRESAEIIELAFCPAPNDYLWVVLVQNGNEFIAWTYNTQSKGLVHGSYSLDYSNSKEVFDEKVRRFRRFRQ